MPISLTPTRRSFIKTAFAGAATAALTPKLAWATRYVTADPHRLVLLSDVHMGASKWIGAHGVNMWENMQQVTREILAMNSGPSAVIVNGDCAYNSGNTGDYACFLESIEPLRRAGLPVHLALGNHDRRENFWNITPHDATREPALRDRQVLMLPLPQADLYMLDSLDESVSITGKLGEAQLRWLAASLDRNPSRPAIIMLHHQPDTDSDGGSGLTDCKAFLDIVQPRTQVKAVLFGHTHVWNYYKQDGIHFVNLPTTSYVFDSKQPAGWVEAMIFNNQMRLQLHALDKKHPKDGEMLNLIWRSTAV